MTKITKTGDNQSSSRLNVKKLDLKKDIQKGKVSVLIVPNNQYSKKINEITRYLSKNYKAVVYVSLNKLITSLEENLKKEGANLSKILIIDGITKSANPNADKRSNVIYVQSASALTEISLTIGKVIDTGKFDVLLFDSLSSLLVYNKSAVVGRFVHSTINKLRNKGITAVFTALEGDTNSDLLKECSMYCDNMVHLK